MKTQKHIATAFLGLMTMALAITACNDKNNAPQPEGSALAIVHASPGNPELTFRINGQKTEVKGLTFGVNIPYSLINPGTYELSVSKKDSTRVFGKTNVDLKSGKVYSAFIADVPAKTGFVLIEDDLTAPVADKANVRFVNMSPDAGSLDLGITGTATPLFTKTNFKGATAFAAVTPGTEVNFEIKENTKTDVLAKLEKVKIEKGKIYTIWAKGLKAATDTTKLAVKILTNK
jgi:hypothetical protein